jgi:dinuclear metal center YbgI/SA1388 family protein
MSTLASIVAWLNDELRLAEVPDYPPAHNGLQLENDGTVTHVAAAVDYSAATTRQALERGADLLLVHHGMFWGGVTPLTGRHYQRLATAIRGNLAVYAAHLPLDVHPRLGNNALLARQLGLSPGGGFAPFQQVMVGMRGECDLPTATLVERARALAHANGGHVIVTPHSADRQTRRWGICTGGGASSATLAEAEALGLDTLVVGEGPHHTGVYAMDADIVVIYAGHYATETLGVRALADAMAQRFGIQSSFIEAPTGL